MKFFNLLAMGMIVCSGVTVQAQTVFQQDFSAEQTAAPTDPAYYEFINLQKDSEGNLVDKWGIVDGALSMENSADFPCTNQTWQRAIKFRNLPLKEKTLYKMTFDINPIETPVDGETFDPVPGYVDVKLMQGDENADICIIDAAGAEQRANIVLTAGEPQTISKLFYFADLKAQNEKYEANCAGKELYAPEKFFAGINVYSPGKYTVDNFLLEEASPLEKIEFNGYSIRMGYVGATNAVTLLNGATRKIYDASLATVKVNGVEVEIEDVELQKDGLYIFTVEEIPADAEVVVTLNAPKEVQFAGGFAGLSLDADGVKAEYSTDESLAAAMPFSFAPAEIVKTTPAEGSFALPTSIEKFTFEFDHEIDGSEIVAKVSNGTTLNVLSVEGKVVTLEGGEFPKGAYTIELINVVNVGTGTPTVVNPTLSFETGEIQLAHTDYTLVVDGKTQLEKEGGIPAGWTLTIGVDADGNPKVHEGGTGSRGFKYSNSNVQSAFYLRDWEGTPVVATSSPVTIPAGDVELRAFTAGWGASGTLNVKLTDANGEVVLDKDIVVSTPLDKNRQGMFQVDPFRFVSNGGEYTYSIELKSGSNELLAGGFEVYSYKETPGDKYEPTVLFTDKTFGDAGDNKTPTAESGWTIVQDGNAREADKDFNYNGTRMFNLGIAGLSKAYYTNGNWSNGTGNYIIYGNGGEGAPVLELPAGNLEFTYYAANWKTNERTVYFQLLNENGDVMASREDLIKMDPNMGGNRNAAGVSAVKVQFSVDVAVAGKYKMKFGGDGEVFVGDVNIVKPGSLAAKWYSKLADAVVEAEAELTASESERLDGTTKSVLVETIGKYKNPANMYTEAEFLGAIDELAAAQADMKERRDAMATYDGVIGNIAGVIAGAEEKYKALESYKVLAELNEKYGAADPTTLENDELVPLAASLKANYDTYTFMSTTGVNLLTKQIQDLKNAIRNMNGSDAYASVLEKADNAVSDDQELATLLKLVYTKLIYDACATEENPFVEVDPDLMIDSPKALEGAGFIANNEFYCNKPMVGGSLAVQPENFPNWNIAVKQGTITSAFDLGWDNTYPTAQRPIANCAVKTQWGDFEYDVQQMLTILPVAMYNFSIQIGEDGGAGDEANPGHGCYAFCGEEQQAYQGKQTADAEGNTKVEYSRDFNQEEHTKTFENVKPVVAEGDVLGTMNIGAHMKLRGGFGNVDNAKLQIVGKVEGFDYAAAAAEVQKMIDKILNGAVQGDVNLDGEVGIADVNAVISVISGDNTFESTADVTNDGEVGIADVNAIINIISGQE